MPKDIEALYREQGLTPKPKTAGELCGPCPWCGGNDRFTIFTGQGKDGLGRFWCRKCEKSGDAIQYLRDRDGLGYKEALRALGLPELPDTPHRPRQAATPAKPPPPAFVPPEMAVPGPVWQAYSAKIVAWAQEQLHQNLEMQAWLGWERGIFLETARAARLGWIPKDTYRSREAFGLPPERGKSGKDKRVWLPRGFCIPVFHQDGRLLRVKFRVWEPGPDRPKYIPLPQVEKCTAPMVLESRAGVYPWQIVESEFDALLMAQEAGHLVNVVSMGSASYRPDAATWTKLQGAPLVLLTLDHDEAGYKAAIQWWETHLPSGRYKLLPVPTGKDPCDAWRDGWNLADWMREVLESGA